MTRLITPVLFILLFSLPLFAIVNMLASYKERKKYPEQVKRETMISSASSINIVKQFIPLCSTISTKQPCEAISMSLTKKFHVLNLTHISNSNSSYNNIVAYNYPSSYSTVMTVRCSSELPIEDQPSISTPTEIPKIDLPPEFEAIPPVPEITQPTPELPGSNPGPEFPGPPIPSPSTPDIPLPPDGLPPDVVPPREVPPPPSTPTPLDVPPPNITPPPVGNFV